jgi:hypothetical protein
MIKLIWLECAKQRALLQPIGDDGTSPLVAGVDVGGGEAETVAYVCEYNYDRRRIIAMGAWRGEDTRGQVVNFLNRYRSRLSLVRVDAIGIGHNFTLHLRDCRFPVELINVAMACESDPQLGENDPVVRFVNLKACFYQTLADAFERDQVDGLTDETTIGQLAGLLYEFDAHGRMKLESKEQARARGVRSPDRADALMLALCKPRQKFEYYTARDLRHWTSGRSDASNISITEHPRGFRELPYDDDDSPYRSRASRRWDAFVGPLRWSKGGGGQHVEGQAAHRGRGIKLLRDRDEGDAFGIEELNHLGEVRQGPSQAVDLVNDHHVDLTRTNIRQQPLQGRTLIVAPESPPSS